MCMTWPHAGLQVFRHAHGPIYMSINMSTLLSTHFCLYACLTVYQYAHKPDCRCVDMPICMCVDMLAWLSTCVLTCPRACLCCTCVLTCPQACIQLCKHANLPDEMCADKSAWLFTWINTWPHAHKHVCQHVHMTCACVPAHLSTHVSTCTCLYSGVPKCQHAHLQVC